MTRYEVVPFRPGKSRCGDCGANLLHLRPSEEEVPEDMTLDGLLPSFFLCTKCSNVSQVGAAKLWPKEDMFGPGGAIEYGECPVCGAEPGQQCSVTDVSGWQPEGPAYVSTTELAGWVHPERGE